MAASMAMKQELENNSRLTAEDDIPGLNHSARHSVSSFSNSPSTPLTAHDDLEVDAFKVPPSGENALNKVESWIDDYMIFPDETDMRFDMFSSSANMMSLPASQRSQGYLSSFAHGHPQEADFLQKANQNRSQLPDMSRRPVSLFRQTLTWFEGSTKEMGQGQQRQQKMKADVLLSRQVQQVPEENQVPKIISPKDVELEYHDTDGSKMPLFPDADQYRQSTYGCNQYGAASQYDWMANQPTISALFPFTFTPTTAASFQGLQFLPRSYCTASGLVGDPESIPDFPVHLTSMESSASEAGSVSTQNSSRSVPEDALHPSSTLIDSGTCSCTYYGCSQRFDSPQKLQKHKRGQRQHPTTQARPSPAISSNMSLATLLARNSQDGSHKCNRISSTTGKPCNTIFSRIYDLTRHEDTIHNGRKQKVRCALCVGGKTFSRNDALMRHMRVVHSEVDFPRKHRR